MMMMMATSEPPPATEAVPCISVDDNRYMADAVRLMASQIPGVRYVQHFVSDEGVLEAIAAHGVKVVVLDYEMPGVDTLALLREIVRISPKCKVMILSAHARPDIVASCYEAGATAYVMKSDPPSEIVRALRALVDSAAQSGGEPRGREY